MDSRDKIEEILRGMDNIVAVILNKIFNKHFSCQWFDTMDPSHNGRLELQSFACLVSVNLNNILTKSRIEMI